MSQDCPGGSSTPLLLGSSKVVNLRAGIYFLPVFTVYKNGCFNRLRNRLQQWFKWCLRRRSFMFMFMCFQRIGKISWLADNSCFFKHPLIFMIHVTYLFQLVWMVSVCPVWSTAQRPACAGDQSQKTQEQRKVMDDGIFDPPKKKVNSWWFKSWPFLGWWFKVTLLRGGCGLSDLQRLGMKFGHLESPPGDMVCLSNRSCVLSKPS